MLPGPEPARDEGIEPFLAASSMTAPRPPKLLAAPTWRFGGEVEATAEDMLA
jgi:hypothetical protein